MPHDLDPRDEQAVSRLLAQARHEAPIPDDVADRIDLALAELGPADVEPGPAGATRAVPGVGVLAMARTRRRRATALLVAAAVIVVVGIGVGQVVRPAEQDSLSAADDASAAATRDRSDPVDREGTAGDGVAGGRAQDPAPGKGSAEAAEPAPEEGLLSGSALTSLRLVSDPPTVRESRFTADVRAVRRELRARAERPDRAPGSARPDFACESADWGPGRTVAVLYDLAPAVLVLRPPAGDTQVVELVQCGTGSVLRSVTLARG